MNFSKSPRNPIEYVCQTPAHNGVKVVQHTANIQSLKHFHYELKQSLDSVKALILFERVAPRALLHKPHTCRAICLQFSGPTLHRGNISIMHLMNGKNGKMKGACTF